MRELRSVNLVKTYKKRKVVNEVSINVKQGEVVGLLGPNGAGKTTTFYMIVGMIQPNSGNVLLDDENITKLPMYKRARMGIGYLSQEPSIFRKLSVKENILAILETMPYSKEKRKTELNRLLNELDISYLSDSKAYNLSGGERRRVEITRAMVTKPSFILLDEPFAGIDPIAVADIQDIVVQLKNKGLGILITDHNVRETLEITDRSYILSQGKIIRSGNAEFLANDPETRRLYLGEKFRL